MDLSAISPLLQNIYTGNLQTSIFTVVDRMGTCGALNIQASIAAASGGNAALITVNTISKSITFATSYALTDSGNYTVTIQIRFAASPFIASASLLYSYLNPCLANPDANIAC